MIRGSLGLLYFKFTQKLLQMRVIDIVQFFRAYVAIFAVKYRCEAISISIYSCVIWRWVFVFGVYCVRMRGIYLPSFFSDCACQQFLPVACSRSVRFSRALSWFICFWFAGFVVGCSGSAGNGTGSYSIDSPPISDSDLQVEAGRWSGEGAIPRPLQDGLFRDILFPYDSSGLSQEQKEQIRRNAQAISSDPILRVEVEGHTDSRGTSDYNFALGEERARTVANLMTAFGVDSSRISIVSYGKEIPVASGNNEGAWAKNRRVHFAVYRKKAESSRIDNGAAVSRSRSFRE